LASASDEILIRSVADSITCPKVEINSSFLLHAPLELLAGAWLLQHLPPHKREDARRRVAEIAVRYASEGSEIESKPKGYSTVDHALRELSAALRAGDADLTAADRDSEDAALYVAAAAYLGGWWNLR